MKLKLMILGKNIITGESNQNDSWERVSNKLEEEYKELQEAITEGDRHHISEEAFDVAQVLVRIFVLLGREKYDLLQLNRRHNKKLVNRGWKESKFINIFIK